ncbi:nucleoside deaminase [Streptomyces sp. NPDC058613]|uniref:nucleoside deaminase n=1 Tax=Streptomyces sp. NPDC058613 TaxID=3346556 RepID=UPI0036527F4C
MAQGQLDFGTAWRTAPAGVRRSLARAYEGLTAGGLAVGAVLTDAAGAVLCEGRNEAYEEGPGNGPLRGTPLAHAEMNALGAARTGWDLGAAVLWSTQEPCGMCAAAARFTGVGAVRYLAPDPWALAAGAPVGTGAPGAWGGAGASGASGAEPVGEAVWLLAANAMFLRSVAVAARGPGEPEILTRQRAVEPETAALYDRVAPGMPTDRSVEEWLDGIWPGLRAGAEARDRRLARP